MVIKAFISLSISTLFFWSFCFAQVNNKFQVSGTVHTANNTPVSSGSVFLESQTQKDRSYHVNLDIDGRFSFKDVLAGTYGIKVMSIGYKILSSNVTITDKDISLNDLILADSTTQLKEVNVTGTQNLLKSDNGKLIIDATAKIYKTSSNALDLISKMPMTTVNQDNIRINGTVEPVILIDGRRSPLSIQEVKNIPASQIKKIEIITNPGAEYEGNYNAVINILMNKTRVVDSSNVNGYLGYGRNRYHQMYGGIGYIHQKTNGHYLQVDYDISKYNTFLDFKNNRITNTQDNYEESTFTDQHPTNHSLRTQYEKTLSKRSKIGVDLRGMLGKYHESTFTNSTLINTLPPADTQFVVSNNKLSSNNNAVASTLFYQLKLKNNGEFSTQVNYAYFDQEQGQQIDIANNTKDIPSSIRSSLNSYINTLSVNADLRTNLWKAIDFSTGVKGSTTTTDNNTLYDTLTVRGYEPDAARSNHFLYDERILAGYMNLRRDFKIFSLTAGLRYEYTKGEGNLTTTNERFTREYGHWLPSANLATALFKKELRVNASYSKKLQRPNFSDMNPFSIITSPYTHIEGNPYLTPTLFNNYEVNLNYKNINLNVSYRFRDHQISQMPFYDFNTQILTLRFVNNNDRRSLAYSLSYGRPLAKWYSFQVSGTLLHDEFNTAFNGVQYNMQGYNFNFTTTHAFTIVPSLMFTLKTYYSTSSVYEVYKFRPRNNITTGIRKEFMNQKFVLVAEYRDIFLGQRDKSIQNTDGFYNAINQFRGSRTLDVRLEVDLQKITNSIKSINIQRSDEENRVKN